MRAAKQEVTLPTAVQETAPERVAHRDVTTGGGEST